MEFEAQPFSSTEIQFQLKSNETTLKSYPFPFVFRIGYRLHSDVLEVSYEVSNPDFKPIYFSVGGHPAFRVPLLPQTEYEDYFLEFNEEETKPRWPISPDGLITKTPEPLLRQSTMLPLTRSLFLRDAIVMKNPSSSMVSLRTDKSPRGLDLDFGEFPYLGIWAAKNADFVCIEPWEGIADSVDSDQQITGKEGIQKLEGGAVFLKTWKARFY
jgi:galactose mutarotase-like enzyme